MAQTSRSSPAIGGAVPTQCIERAKELADRSNEVDPKIRTGG